ncbi:MAG TPA: patatin-like phospholipase family protein [Dehalococcoidia bacterium]|nr:patatin-like phospholipase family protein [Dehalococcoidia bacterium]
MAAGRARIGLALGAGGTKGTAHAGVLKVLDEAGIPIDFIAGSSIGAAYGASYAAGASGAEMAANVRRMTPADVVAFFKHRLRLTPDNPIGSAFYERFDGLTFDDLRVPFTAVASDLFQRRPVLLRRGSLLRAVEASIAVPLMAAPVRHDGRYVLDGGFWEQAPVRVAAGMGAEKVVQVVLGESIAMPRPLRPPTRRLVQALDGPVRHFGPGLAASSLFLLYTLTCVAARSHADVTIRPDVVRISANSPFHLAIAMRRGEEAARAALPEIEALLR